MLRDLYQRELGYLWSGLAQAARKHVGLAPLWSRDGDGRVARVVEAAAYAFARVRERLEDDLPELAHALVGGALPEVLRPSPSATILQLSDAALARRSVSLHSKLAARSRSVGGAPCSFESCWSVTTAPLRVVEARVRIRERGTQSLFVRIEAYGDRPLTSVLPGALRFFLHTADPMAAIDLACALRRCSERPRVTLLGRSRQALSSDFPGASVAWCAVDDPWRFLPGTADRFSSSSALRALRSFPELFGFVEVRGLESMPRHDGGVTLEITLPLATPIAGALTVMTDQVRLDCVPAVNVFQSRARPLHTAAAAGQSLEFPGHPAAELFEVTRAVLVRDGDPDRPEPLSLWEHAGAPTSEESGLLLKLERRSSPVDGRVEVSPTLFQTSDARVPAGMLVLDALATDGARTAGLLPLDVTYDERGTPASNPTRVTRARSAVLDANLAWRVNAFARMPIAQFARPSRVASFLHLHDLEQVSRTPGPARLEPRELGVLRVTRRPLRRVIGEVVAHGDGVDLELDATCLGGVGARWLTGELLARAFAERDDLLRFTRVRLATADGSIDADYGYRSGARLPPPFG